MENMPGIRQKYRPMARPGVAPLTAGRQILPPCAAASARNAGRAGKCQSVFARKSRNALAAAGADARAVLRRKTTLFRRNAGSET